ncbi:hypothetical protein EDC96DRAFT_590569 [Choanephora cucurbitarum]|nr:hypothetical protein EDC96DRAFT_590569 [Choanephora cucurbitarum]
MNCFTKVERLCSLLYHEKHNHRFSDYISLLEKTIAETLESVYRFDLSNFMIIPSFDKSPYSHTLKVHLLYHIIDDVKRFGSLLNCHNRAYISCFNTSSEAVHEYPRTRIIELWLVQLSRPILLILLGRGSFSLVLLESLITHSTLLSSKPGQVGLYTISYTLHGHLHRRNCLGIVDFYSNDTTRLVPLRISEDVNQYTFRSHLYPNLLLNCDSNTLLQPCPGQAVKCNIDHTIHVFDTDPFIDNTIVVNNSKFASLWLIILYYQHNFFNAL